MIGDLTLRWVVTILFVLSAVECLGALAVGSRRWTNVVGQLLHVVMAVAMAVMAWPWGAALPTVAPMVFFLLATGWFVAITVSPIGAGHRLGGSYHALMMLAMAWMYAVMNGRLLPGQVSHSGHVASADSPAASSGHAGHGGMQMPGMDMPGMDLPADSSGGGYPAYIATLNWVWTLLFAVAAVVWLWRYLAIRMNREPADPGRTLGILCQAMMAAGMAIMFGVML
ncbi:DUF5134 domain-containing protein [Mycobacterium sp. CVI_P3]|uniref:DUF5134 domain-containing protein n=1 Tax=Mycobacterium pinniadriaticum TaxID=2994102 RepID=A0ABT3SBU2_9MYCO|nr:DUF5134 domain-containing protein [Mycobacterium pinniadriaticum]MCX2930566.1 DUF5134 domain-containing protein [Mycobacterium pinniadriaticum]MCX2936990.1 DUF5134 domain-containing protein [Mycobacterium pinniadriaticum]